MIRNVRFTLCLSCSYERSILETAVHKRRRGRVMHISTEASTMPTQAKIEWYHPIHSRPSPRFESRLLQTPIRREDSGQRPSEEPTPSLPLPIILHINPPSLPPLQPPQPLRLLQHPLEQLLPPHDVQMPPNLRILPREPLKFRLGQSSPQPCIQLSREQVEELCEELGVQEEVCSRGEAIGDGVEEDLGAVKGILA